MTSKVPDNPSRKGDYLVYGHAQEASGNRFQPYYRIDLHPEGGPKVRTVMGPTECLAHKSCATAADAEEDGINFGLAMVDAFK